MHMSAEVSRVPSRPRTAESPSEPADIEACSVTYAVTPPISNEPQRGSAASDSAALAAAAAFPYDAAAPPHSAATAGEPPVHQPEASQLSGTAPRNINAPSKYRYQDTAVRAPTVDGLQAQGGSGSGAVPRNIYAPANAYQDTSVHGVAQAQGGGGSWGLHLDDTQSASGSRENQTDSFTSRLASCTSSVFPTAMAAAGGHNLCPKSFLSRKT